MDEKDMYAVFTGQQDDGALIQTVGRYGCLWDTSDVYYRNREMRTSAWKDVLHQLNVNVTAGNIHIYKAKWSNIRSSYNRSLAPPPSGSGANAHKKPYKYAKLLSFLEKIAKPRKTRPWTNFEASSPNYDSQTDDISISSDISLDDPLTPNTPSMCGRQSQQQRTAQDEYATMELHRRCVVALEKASEAALRPRTPAAPSEKSQLISNFTTFLESLLHQVPDDQLNSVFMQIMTVATNNSSK